MRGRKEHKDSGYKSTNLLGRYRWARGGLLGIDFGSKDIDDLHEKL